MSTSKSPARRDDQPFDFNLDTVEAETELRPFVVHFAGRRWTFAHMQALNIWPLMAAAEAGDLASVQASFKAALGDKEWAALQGHTLPQFKMAALFQAYEKHCGFKPGESAASADS